MRSVGTVEARHPRKWMTNSPQSCMKIESYMLRHVEIRTWKIQLFFAFVTRPPTRAAFAAAPFALHTLSHTNIAKSNINTYL